MKVYVCFSAFYPVSSSSLLLLETERQFRIFKPPEDIQKIDHLHTSVVYGANWGANNKRPISLNTVNSYEHWSLKRMIQDCCFERRGQMSWCSSNEQTHPEGIYAATYIKQHQQGQSLLVYIIIQMPATETVRGDSWKSNTAERAGRMSSRNLRMFTKGINLSSSF
jgi:hypothetical protein